MSFFFTLTLPLCPPSRFAHHPALPIIILYSQSGDGYVDMVEIEKNMNPQLRKKIEEKLDGGCATVFCS